MMAAPTSKRRCFSIEEKGAIVAWLENGESNAKLALEFNVSHSTISTIWKNKNKIVRAFNENELKTKRLRESKHSDIDRSLHEWFKCQRSKNVPLTGPILRQKANEFAALMGKEYFQCSEGWINRFRARHNIVFGKIVGEAASVPDGVVESWIQTVFKEIRKGYSDDEIFNADETGLFFKMTYDKTLRFKGESCAGGKMSKDRITANMTGTQKRKLLVIGKSQNPRCFKNVKTLPVCYEANRKAWMTSEIFIKFLRDWDKEWTKSGKKILLFVDNCPAHPSVENLGAIKLVFLPPNCTSVLQPMDQGVIHSLKTQYRKLQIIETIKNIELGKENTITVLDAILMVSAAWEKVTAKTISGCFRHAGFTSQENKEMFTEEFDEEDDIPLAQWMNNSSEENMTNEELIEFVNVDNQVATWGDLTEQEIVKGVSGENAADDEETDNNLDNDNADYQVPSCAEALQAVSVLKKFLMLGNIQDRSLMDTVSSLDGKFLQLFYQSRCKKQSKITDYFSV